MRDSRWVRIRKRAWRDHVKRMDENRLAKIVKIAKIRYPNDLDGFQNVDAKVGHWCNRRTDTE